jgi:Yip1-like protein
MQVARLLCTSPTKAFEALKAKPVFALPMFLTLAGVALVTAWYYAKVDIAWLADQTLAAAKMTAEQQQRVAATMTRPVMLWSSTIIAPIGVAIIMTIGSLYLVIAGNITNVRYSFKQWFAFNWWAASPQIVAYIPSLLILALSSSTQMQASTLAPLSLNELVFHRAVGTPGYSLLSSLGLVQVATIWLTYIGVRAWSGRSALFCWIFTLLPTVLIYGVWALFAFR